MAAPYSARARIYITGDREGATLQAILDTKPSNEELRRWILLGYHYATRRGQDVHVSENLQISVLQPKRTRPSSALGGLDAGSSVAAVETDAVDSEIPTVAPSPPLPTVTPQAPAALTVPAPPAAIVPRAGLSSVNSVVSQFIDFGELE